MESSTDKIIDRILNNVRAEAKTIVNEAKSSAELVIEKRKEKASHDAEKEASLMLRRAENEAEVIKGKVATDIKRKASWIVLAEKERLVTSVLNEVKNKLVNLQKSAEYLHYLY